MKKIISLAVLLTAILMVAGCNGKKSKGSGDGSDEGSNNSAVPATLYMDNRGMLHASKDCKKIEGGISVIDTKKEHIEGRELCPECFSEAQLKAISECANKCRRCQIEFGGEGEDGCKVDSCVKDTVAADYYDYAEPAVKEEPADSAPAAEAVPADEDFYSESPAGYDDYYGESYK